VECGHCFIYNVVRQPPLHARILGGHDIIDSEGGSNVSGGAVETRAEGGDKSGEETAGEGPADKGDG
jgi:hypothetical protein